MLNQLLKKYKGAKATTSPNYSLIPVTRIEMCESGAREFNQIFFACKKEIKNQIKRTPSGGISIVRLRLPSYDVRTLPYCVELTILSSKMVRLQFRSKIRDMDQTSSGRRAFQGFCSVLKNKFNMNITDFAIENGRDLKKEIELPMIEMGRETFRDLAFNNVHHVDFHSSYPAGLINTHPEFEEPVKFMYNKRKKFPLYKAVLDYSIGFMQSSFCGYRYTHLSRDAIADNNRRVKKLAEDVKKAGRVILLYNTDGFWYSGDIYHGEGEGPDIGQWSNDHVNCQFRAKSKGCYEFIEDGKYHPVVRGRTKYETIVARENWQWGDIYREDCVAIKWTFNIEEGVKEDEEI